MPTEKTKSARQAKRARALRTISIIGAGRLGTALATALEGHGYTIEAVVARRRAHARRAARQIESRPQALTSAELQQLPQSDLLLITTPDDAIVQTARELAASFDGKTKGRVALHGSGALSSEVLSPLREQGFRVGSMHPLVSISEPVEGAESLRWAFYCVEGDTEAVRVARRLVRDLGGESFSIAARDKALYHAAAVMASGHVAALFDIALEMLGGCGLSQRRAREVLIPLLESMTKNLHRGAPARALTGTFARADTATVRRHLEALQHLKDSAALDVYRLLGERSVRLAARSGADENALAEILKILETASSK